MTAELLSKTDIDTLAALYKEGCKIRSITPDDNAMLDIIRFAKSIRALHCLINMAIQEKMPITFVNGQIKLLDDK